MADDGFRCVLSGREAKDEDLVTDAREDDDLEELPLGWVRVTVERRVLNPAWARLQRHKQIMIERMKAGIDTAMPPEMRVIEEELVETLVTGQLTMLDQTTPKYLTYEDEAILCDPSVNKQVGDEWKKISEALEGLDVGLTP
jgi:hypothetical protein